MNSLNFPNPLSRRNFLRKLSVLGVVGGPTLCARAQAGSRPKSVFRAVELNHISLDATRIERSAEFYQVMFGMTPISHGRGDRASFLHFQEGFLNLRPAESAGMNHFCLSIEEFDVDSVFTMLNALDLKPWVQGGGNLLHVRDPDGINVQVQEIGHGWRRTQGQLANADKGTFAAVRLHHVSLNVTNVARSRDFYREMFGVQVVSVGKNMDNCVLGVGQSFVELRKATKPGMHHYCYGVKRFEADRALKELAKANIKVLQSNASRRLSFRDPQDLLVQLDSVDAKFE